MNLRFTIYDLRDGGEKSASHFAKGDGQPERGHSCPPGAFHPLRTGMSALRNPCVNRKSQIVNSAAAFTMVEIAISLAVIAFALVAIIGVLPMGLNVQRENREDTLVNQDGQYFLEAIRGAQGVDNLTNFVEYITIESWTDSMTNVVRYYDSEAFAAVPIKSPPFASAGTLEDKIRTGRDIIGFLTTPKFMVPTNGASIQTNRVTASIHALTGAAIEQGKATRDLSYAYQLTSEIVPFGFFGVGPVSFNLADGSPQNLARSNRFLEVTKLCGAVVVTNGNDVSYVLGRIEDTKANMFDVRLSLRWPLKPDGIGGPRRQQFRAIVGAQLKTEPPVFFQTSFPPYLWFFQSQQYSRP